MVIRLVPERRRPLFSLAIAALLVAVVLATVLGVVLPARAPAAFDVPVVAQPRLASRLMLVIVDGLRHDVATDHQRMPHFAAAMERETAGELWAGRVSMTTSAVLAMATGQRGGFEQIVRNLDASPPPYDSWLIAARAAGMTSMSVGDPAWGQMFGRAFAERRVDPKGVAIDVDFNPITFRDARELRSRSPDVLIVHFVTPDHQAHAYSVTSQRYADHIRGFDADLFRFLGENDASWTVVVAGDHGAADSGTHGADVPIQRRSALFARGPGVATGVKAGIIDQADLGGTFAALLGLPLPAHSRGHVRVDLLDVTPAERVRVACADAVRAEAFARASGLRVEPRAAECGASPAPLDHARRVVRQVDAAFEGSSGLASPAVPWLAGLVVVLGLLAAFAAAGAAHTREIAAALVLVALGVLLTWGVERLPGSSPNSARLALFVGGNVPALVALLVPGRLATWANRRPWLAVVAIPGLLVATYTTNAQPEAYVAVVVSSLLVVLVGGLEPARATLLAAKRVLGPAHLGVLALCLVVLYFGGTRTSDIYPGWLRRDPSLTLATGVALLAVVGAVFGARSGHRRRLVTAGGLALLAIAALVARRFVPALPGRALIVVFGVATLILALRRQRLAALLLGFGTYAWVSRDAEILALGASVLLADGVGAAFARHRALTQPGGGALEPAQLALITTFVFGLAFVQRIGIQGAIDFGSMDFGVAGFGDPHVPAWVVGGALGLKYLLGLWLVLGAVSSELGREHTPRVLQTVFLVFLARTVVVSVMFLIAGSSYWTGFRLIGDLPFAMLWVVAAGVAWVVYSRAP
ncbi:MAG: alkaline phosphatase family protein [Myxococcales bacterium]|nr:alkaline phosphatase family protein [Myxococcales bacterium]